MKPYQLKNELLQRRIKDLGGKAEACTLTDAHALRMAESRLHRWHERSCGNSDGRVSWMIEEDETTGLAYWVTYFHDGRPEHRRRIPHVARAERKRVAAICERLGLQFHEQSDPRGRALYVGGLDVPADDYHRMICCFI